MKLRDLEGKLAGRPVYNYKHENGKMYVRHRIYIPKFADMYVEIRGPAGMTISFPMTQSFKISDVELKGLTLFNNIEPVKLKKSAVKKKADKQDKLASVI